MGHRTSYENVMGVSGACFRLAFCSPGWDYSSVDGLVAYDYAAPGYKAFGYKTEMRGHVEKQDRPEQRERMMKDIRGGMPVLGINLRVAPEWGVICGYDNEGADLYCRTKYDAEVLGSPEYRRGGDNPYDYLRVDNWPFLISYFAGKEYPPSGAENLINSLKIFIDCSGIENTDTQNNSGYYMGFKAYEVWINDLLDRDWYKTNGGEQFARRFSVDQFCALALCDARKAAYAYLSESAGLLPGKRPELEKLAALFKTISENAEQIHHMLDSGEYLEGERARVFWTDERRAEQARLLTAPLALGREAAALAGRLV
jgi:hypothetical protein